MKNKILIMVSIIVLSVAAFSVSFASPNGFNCFNRQGAQFGQMHKQMNGPMREQMRGTNFQSCEEGIRFRKEMMDLKVKYGHFTQEQANERLQRMQQNCKK